jgi:hypothetical protein
MDHAHHLLVLAEHRADLFRAEHAPERHRVLTRVARTLRRALRQSPPAASPRSFNGSVEPHRAARPSGSSSE